MRQNLYASLAAFLAVLPGPSQAQDYSPEAVASAILAGFVARDVAAIGAHANDITGEFFDAVLAGELDGGSVFNGLEGRAATQWDGLILPVRYHEGRAIVPFAIEVDATAQSLSTGANGRYFAVFLSLDGPDDTSWGIDDLNFVLPSDYVTYPETR